MSTARVKKQPSKSRAARNRQKIRIRYNAPVTLTFSFLSVAALILSMTVLRSHPFFIAPGAQFGPMPFNWKNVFDYARLFLHVLGHASWNHLLGNLAFILLLGPMLEERFGSLPLLLMIIVTAFVTGILNACFIPTGLMGASGIAFMMILLASFTNFSKNEIPLTFILIVFLYLGREIVNSVNADNVSGFAHLAGGICGSMFGFFSVKTPPPRQRASRKTTPPQESQTPQP